MIHSKGLSDRDRARKGSWFWGLEEQEISENTEKQTAANAFLLFYLALSTLFAAAFLNSS